MYQYRDLNFSDQPRPLGQVSPGPLVVGDGADVAALESRATDLETIANGSGWAVYVNTAGAQTLTASTKVALVNNAGTKITTQHPIDVAALYDGTVITGRTGDSIGIGLELTFTPSSGVASSLYLAIDIGGGVGEIYPRDFAILKGSGVAHRISYVTMAYTLDTWAANGGTIRVESDGPGDITAVRYVIHRLHKAR